MRNGRHTSPRRGRRGAVLPGELPERGVVRQKRREGYCAVCRERRQVHGRTEERQPLCSSHSRKRERCDDCGKLRAMNWRRNSEGKFCSECGAERFNLSECRHCHELRPVHMRTPGDDPWCRRCYRKYWLLATCDHCGEVGRIDRREGNLVFCYRRGCQRWARERYGLKRRPPVAAASERVF